MGDSDFAGHGLEVQKLSDPPGQKHEEPIERRCMADFREKPDVPFQIRLQVGSIVDVRGPPGSDEFGHASAKDQRVCGAFASGKGLPLLLQGEGKQTEKGAATGE